MSTPTHYDVTTKHKLIPPHMRGAVKAGEAPLYVLNAPDYDRMPNRTYLVETCMGTGGLMPERVHIIVTPNEPANYMPSKKTPGGRLLLTFWVCAVRLPTTTNGRTTGKTDMPPRAVKLLADPKRTTYRHVVMPGDDGYELMMRFEDLCQIRRAGANRAVSPEMLIRALGIGEERDKLLRQSAEWFT